MRNQRAGSKLLRIGDLGAVRAAAPGGKIGIVVYDSFTDTDGVDLDAHYPDISPDDGTWDWNQNGTEIVSNRATSPGSYSRAYIDTGLADCKITAKVACVEESTQYFRGVGLYVRSADPGNVTGFLITINDYSDTFLLVEQTSASTFTTRDEASVTLTAGQEYTIVATLNGSTITATLDGGNELSYASATANQTSPRHGVWIATAATGSYVDDFTVEGL